MKCMVAVKRVVDPFIRIKVKDDGSGVNLDNIKMTMNPFDEIALEEAIRMKEKGWVSEICVVSIGGEKCQETLRHGLALGADQAILVKTNLNLISLNVAKILKAVSEKYEPNIILMGKQSIDGDNNQTAQMLAGLLQWPQGTNCSKIEYLNDKIEVTRETDAGNETLQLMLPAVLSSDLRLNEPRYASLPNIMKSKQKPLEVIELDQLQLELSSGLKILKVSAPPSRRQGIMVNDVDELLDKLKHEAQVL